MSWEDDDDNTEGFEVTITFLLVFFATTNATAAPKGNQ